MVKKTRQRRIYNPITGEYYIVKEKSSKYIKEMKKFLKMIKKSTGKSK